MRLRIIFMGTPDFAVPTLAALVEAHEVVHVYTQPPRPAGRGYALTPSPVQSFAQAHGIAVSSPVSLRSEAETAAFRALGADIAVVVAYGLLLPTAILEGTRLGCLNIHGSLLPRWRGAAPIQRALMAGDRETGICIMQMDAGLDTGPVYAEARVAIHPTTTSQHLFDELSLLGAKTLVAALPAIASKTLTSLPQSAEGVTYAHRLTREEGKLDWSQPAATLDRQVRALTPWPGTWCLFRGERLKVLEVVPGGEAMSANSPSKAPGRIIDHHLAVVCGDGAVLRLQRVQLAGGKSMTAHDFVRGHRVQVGDVLT